MASTVDLGAYQYHFKTQGDLQSPPLLFLHGFMGSSQDFEWVVAVLSQDFFCISVDLPGHGKTKVFGDESCYDMAAIALSLVQFLDALNLHSCHLLGYSMGGRLALYLAIHYPQYVRAVILESASPGLATAAERRDRRRHDDAIADRLEQENFELFLEDWYRQPLFRSLRAHPSYGEMIQRRRQNDPHLLARSLRRLSTGRQPSLWPDLAHLSCPCLWMVGEKDEKFVRIGHQIKLINSDIHLQIVAQRGHSIHQESPEQFVSQIYCFMGTKKSAPE